MRQVHPAGAKCFVDYAGKTPSIIDATTGEVIAVELFVAGLGASNYTYAEATRTQQVRRITRLSHEESFNDHRLALDSRDSAKEPQFGALLSKTARGLSRLRPTPK